MVSEADTNFMFQSFFSYGDRTDAVVIISSCWQFEKEKAVSSGNKIYGPLHVSLLI